MNDSSDVALDVDQRSHDYVINFPYVHVVVNVLRESLVALAIRSNYDLTLLLNSDTSQTCFGRMHDNIGLIESEVSVDFFILVHDDGIELVLNTVEGLVALFSKEEAHVLELEELRKVLLDLVLEEGKVSLAEKRPD